MASSCLLPYMSRPLTTVMIIRRSFRHPAPIEPTNRFLPSKSDQLGVQQGSWSCNPSLSTCNICLAQCSGSVVLLMRYQRIDQQKCSVATATHGSAPRCWQPGESQIPPRPIKALRLTRSSSCCSKAARRRTSADRPEAPASATSRRS